MKKIGLISSCALMSLTVVGYAATDTAPSAQAKESVKKEDLIHTCAIKVGEKIDNRELKGEGHQFPVSLKQIWAQAVMAPLSDTTVTFVWKKEGAVVHRFAVPVKKGNRYRVHAFKNISEGKWSVAIEDAHQQMVSETEFTVHQEGADRKEPAAAPKASADVPVIHANTHEKEKVDVAVAAEAPKTEDTSSTLPEPKSIESDKQKVEKMTADSVAPVESFTPKTDQPSEHADAS